MTDVPRITTPAQDTIVVPAHGDNFNRMVLVDHVWHHNRVAPGRIQEIEYIALYQVAPKSAIAHVARVREVKPWEETGKYAFHLDGPAQEIGPISLAGSTGAKQLRGPRYRSYVRLLAARTMDDI